MLPLPDVRHCCKLSLYLISRKTNEPNLRKWQKTWAAKIFWKMWLCQPLDTMASYHHVQYQKTLMIQSWENLVTNGQADWRTDRGTDGPTEGQVDAQRDRQTEGRQWFQKRKIALSFPSKMPWKSKPNIKMLLHYMSIKGGFRTPTTSKMGLLDTIINW